MTIAFKSSGRFTNDRDFKPTVNEVPIGIKTPLSLGTGASGLFTMNFNLADQVQDNLRNLILTNHGERLGFHDFGANLKPLTLELASEDFESEVMRRIKASVSKYMPYVNLQSFEYTVDRSQNQNTAKMKLRLIYGVPKLNIERKGLELTLYIGG